MLVQLQHTADSGDMYHENYGFKSGVSDSIREDLKDAVSTALEYHESPRRWLDIASNDGTLLSFVPDSIYRAGVDPIEKYCIEASFHADTIINEFFNGPTFKHFNGGDWDIITSISCFYDMDDPNKFVKDVYSIMSDNGIWLIQQNYLLSTMQLGAVDNFCAEHLEYYTLLSLEPLLERHNLEVIDLSTSMVNGGSLRTIVAKKGVYGVSTNVHKQRDIEKEYRLNTLAPYLKFAEEALENVADLKALLYELKKAGNLIYILAASTRGSTIWQTAGIDKYTVPCAVERNPEKVGRYFSALGIPIISEEEARKNKPDYMLIGPWFFATEIIAREAAFLKDGGRLIKPLPKLEII